jgi:hypothetical protein
VKGWLLPALVGVCLAACFIEFLRGCPYFSAFTWDQRLEMLTWMDGNLPPCSKVVADPSVLLANLLVETKQKSQFKLLTDDRLTDPGDRSRYDQVVAAGVDYAVVSASDYKPFFSNASALDTAGQSSNSVQQFYSELSKKGTLVWSRERGAVPYLEPGLEIYHLPKSEARAADGAIGN